MKVLEFPLVPGSGDSIRGMDGHGQIGKDTTRTYMKHFSRH